ncbi:hypothetical protein I204_03487 [Kwoniella mangroviensis CBS 8886]|uniref:uncharacterized protein n=1 Tax=Kwoniella mangroviensis CBS 8507 TaxID=1296122 RepID=UPI00080D735A|nr:uncharacterized protein I203_00546 [Kwoniella mangroviensis CBS 8507]OCF70412.1 hypothetical protein I203_00546 [Kwoniella mangroviensis CBS 8507]OCF76188.1 hypothetical protein I204_03487 [Kwoniella mangroviensis CBS 8886]
MSVNFSPYQPPPDVPSTDPPESSTKKGKSKRPWFTRDQSSYATNSYQSGGSISDPTSQAQAYSNDPEAAGLLNGSGSGMGNGAFGEGDRANAWESRFGWRVDFMAAAAYLGGPVTALLFLILETQNDYVRFHAYQSALFTTPLLILYLIFKLIIVLPTFLRIIYILAAVGGMLYVAFRAWKDAQEGLSRYWLPYIGEIAERWVGEE